MRTAHSAREAVGGRRRAVLGADEEAVLVALLAIERALEHQHEVRVFAVRVYSIVCSAQDMTHTHTFFSL